ncbi:MAG: hypothetical protein JWN69_664 [Alphaproteobacteria bacterium]|nr:hypothetical protein [Alphaproteobacteria bacterium]
MTSERVRAQSTWLAGIFISVMLVVSSGALHLH